MADENNEMQIKLEEAKKKTEQAAAELEEAKNRVAEIQAIDLKVDCSLPQTKAVIGKIEKNLKTIKTKNADLVAMREKVLSVVAGAKAFRQYEFQAETVLRLVKHLASHKRYADALLMLEEMNRPILNLDFGMPLVWQKVAKGIYAWTKADLYAKKGERDLENGEYPLSSEQLADYSTIVDGLLVDLRDENAKDFHLDKYNGFLFSHYARQEKERPHDKETFLDIQAKRAQVAGLEGNMSDLTKQRADEVIQAYEDEFNELSVAAFEEHRNYEEALFYFQNKQGIQPDRITHKAFREAQDEQQFHLFFLESEALKKSDDDFVIDCRALVVGIQGKDDFSVTVLAHYLALDDLPSEKLQLLMRELANLPFEKMLYVAAQAMLLGIEEPRQALIVDALAAHKKKRGNLEDMAEFILVLLEKLEDAQKAKFQALVKGLIRSPHARKVITKSQDGAVHALTGEDRENFKKPLGKKCKNPNVKYWDILNKFMYIVFAIILPLAVAAAGFAVIYFLKDLGLARKFLFLAPFGVGFIAVHIAIILRFGRDEHGSAIARRIIGADALWKAVLALLFFILPTQLSVLADFGYFLCISAAVEGFWGFIVFKDRRKFAGFLFYLPTLLATIASVVFIVLDLMKGII